MPYNVFDYDSSPYTHRILDESIPETFSTFLKSLDDYGHFENDPTTSGNLYTGKVPDNNVRVPVCSSSVELGGISNLAIPTLWSDWGTAWSLNTSGYVQNQSINMLEYMPRLYVKSLGSIQDYVGYASGFAGRTFNYAYEVKYQPSSSYPNGWKVVSIGSISDLYARYPDLLYPEALACYTNKNDGTLQTKLWGKTRTSSGGDSEEGTRTDVLLPIEFSSAIVPKVKVMIPMLQYLIRGVLAGDKNVEGAGLTYGGMFAQRVSDLPYQTGSFHMILITENQLNLNENPFHGYGYASSHNLTGSISGASCLLKLATKSAWERAFNSLGMPWSYNLDDIISPVDDGLNKPDEAGDPTDPKDDDDGDGDKRPDPIPLPDVKYNPTKGIYDQYWIRDSDLTAYKNFLFSTNFLDYYLRLGKDPLDYVIDLTYFPLDPISCGYAVYDPVGTPVFTGGIYAENVQKAYLYSDKGKALEMGTIDVPAPDNSYLDYAPYTSIDIYLPYIGVRPLDTNQVVGKTIHITGTPDFINHQITENIFLVNSDKSETLIESYTGTFGVTYPLSGVNAAQQAISYAQKTIGVVTGAAGIALSAVAGDVTGGVMSGMGLAKDLMNIPVTQPKTHGTLGATSAIYAPQYPYITITSPIKALPNESFYNQVRGRANSKYNTVAHFGSGFIQASDVKITDIKSAYITAGEVDEIISLLKGGIYGG